MIFIIALFYSIRKLFFSSYPNRLKRTHFLTAKTPDTLSVMIHRRMIFSFFKRQCLSLHRTGFHADATFSAFFCKNIWLRLKRLHKKIQLIPHGRPYFSPVHIVILISIFFHCFFHGNFSFFRKNADFFFFPKSQSHILPGC